VNKDFQCFYDLNPKAKVMIRTIGFESDLLSLVTDHINEWIGKITEDCGDKFKLIDIKYAASSEPVQAGYQSVKVNYSAMIIYESPENQALMKKRH
jgi:hypothetical protein